MMRIKNIYLGSLTSLAIMASSVVSAEEMVTVPELEGGITASVGTWLATPSSTQLESYRRIHNHIDAEGITPGYEFGIEASLGYIFEDTANGIDLYYRNLNTSDSSTVTATNPFMGHQEELSAHNNLGYELNAFDLMISQFMDIGTHMQMRFGAGLAYAEVEEEEKFNSSLEEFGEIEAKQESEFTGWGPRLAIDARYDFGEDLAGFGIVAGGSVAYLLGDLDSTTPAVINEAIVTTQNDMDSQAVTNLRGNVGIDYVYFFDNEELSTLGLELGYQVDYYADALAVTQVARGSAITNTEAITFSGPYLNLKGAF